METWVWSLGWEDPLKKGKSTYSSILAWRIPWLYSPWGHKESDTTEWLSHSLCQERRGASLLPVGLYYPGSRASPKESICNAGDNRDAGLTPGKIPWKRKWQPTPVCMPGKSQRWRCLVSYSLKGRKELDMTKQLSAQTHTHPGSKSSPFWSSVSYLSFLFFFFFFNFCSVVADLLYLQYSLRPSRLLKIGICWNKFHS